ncbi:MAG: DnaJ-like cysteine-rich domain-containing protein [Candidatus Helarchaeales archaeon]
MSSSLDRNVERFTSAYKQNISPLSKGTWLAVLARFRYDDDGAVREYPEELVSGVHYLPSPILVRVDQKTFYQDVRILMNYDKAVFSHYEGDVPIYVPIENQKTEIVIPKNTREETLINPGISDVVKINSIEIIEGLNKPLEFTILALASTNTKFASLFTFDHQIDVLYQLMFSRFINKLPCWMCNGTGEHENSTCPNCNGTGEDQTFFTGALADNIALDLNLFRKTLTESDETLRRRAWGQRRWVIPRNMRNLDSNIHSLLARYLDVDEDDIFIYEKSPNFYSIDPEASWRPKTRGWDYFAEWNHDGTEAHGTYLRYEEIIKNKNFEDRLIVSTHRGHNVNWINCFTGDGKHDNTAKVEDHGYSFQLVGQQGYTGIYQKVDFTEMNEIALAYRLEGNSYLPHVPPGFLKGKIWILTSSKALPSFSMDESGFEDLISSGNILHQETLFYEDYPSPQVTELSLDASSITGEKYLYFVVKSEWDEVYFTIEIIQNDYGTAIATSPVYDNEQRTSTSRVFTFFNSSDPSASIQWRYRASATRGGLFTSSWSEWKDHDDYEMELDDIRYVQFQIKLSSSKISTTSPIYIDEFDFMVQHVARVGIILDPTVTVSMPIFGTGDNAWWTYLNGDQERFKELVDSVVTGCVTVRTEFYIEVGDEL